MAEAENNGDMYWSVVIPTLTRQEAELLLSMARSIRSNLEGSLVDPYYFFSLHIDRDSAETVHAALNLLMNSSTSSIQEKGTARGLTEIINDWIDSGGRYLGE